MTENNLHPLTKSQSDFAAKNYELVFSFLSGCKLDADEYHDAVIMHYLRAVQVYDERPELQTEPFAVVAKRLMLSGVMRHIEKQNRRQIAETLHVNGLERNRTGKVLYLRPAVTGTRFRVVGAA